ncbi:hypothetical protein NHX12_005790, partial [Muraenolepis orangiensis]
RRAWSVHKRECRCLQSLLPRTPTDSVRLAARILLAASNLSAKQSEELYTIEEHESHLDLMSEQKRRGLSQLADMFQIYLRPEIPDLMKEMTSALPPSCQDPLGLLAKVQLWILLRIAGHMTTWFPLKLRDASGLAPRCTYATAHGCSARVPLSSTAPQVKNRNLINF